MCFAGKLEETGELTEKEIIRAERNSGVISNRVREIQVSIFFFLRLIVAMKLKLHTVAFEVHLLRLFMLDFF